MNLLIGNDQLYDVVLWDQIYVARGLRAVETMFGYVLHGRVSGTSPLPLRLSSYRVQTLWDLDVLGVKEEELAADSKRTAPLTWNSKEGLYEMWPTVEIGRSSVVQLQDGCRYV